MHTPRERQQRRIQALATDLANHVGTNVDEDLDACLEQAVNSMLGDDLTNAAMEVEEEDSAVIEQIMSQRTYQDLKEAVRLAATKCKEMKALEGERKEQCSSSSNDNHNNTLKSEATSNMSFSLFASSNAMGGFSLDRFVTAEQLQEAQQSSSSLEETIKLLEKVPHVDDVMHSWKDMVLPFLSQGFLQQEFKCRCLNLCRTWFFDHCNSLQMEHVLVQSDVCRVISRMLTTHTSHKAVAEEPDFAMAVVQTWHDMWMAVLPRYSHLDDDTDMELCIWSQFTTSSALPLLLALLDPYSMWFARWVAQMPPMRLVKLLGQCRSLVPYLIQRGQTESSNSMCIPPQLAKELNVHNVLKEGTLVQSLCMLRSILLVTRVALFPWGVMPEPLDDGKDTDTTGDEPSPISIIILNPSLEQAQHLLNLFVDILHVGILKPNVVPLKLAYVCGEGVQAILHGGLQGQEIFEPIISVVMKRLCVGEGGTTSMPQETTTLSPCRCVTVQLCHGLIRDELITERQEAEVVEAIKAALRGWILKEEQVTAQGKNDLLDLMQRLLDDNAVLSL